MVFDKNFDCVTVLETTATELEKTPNKPPFFRVIAITGAKAVKNLEFTLTQSYTQTSGVPPWYSGYRLRVLCRRSQFNPHSQRFTWQVNEPSPQSTHAL